MIGRIRVFRCIPALALAAIGVLASGCNSLPAGASVPFSRVDLQIGTGAEATTGAIVTVDYSAWLYSDSGEDHKGLMFDTSEGRTPLIFRVGGSGIITGIDTGVLGMRVGGVRRLVIPPNLAFGAQGQGVIPPNSALIFEVQLVDVQTQGH
jgi:FKBP-type peptidyl-prolyl cis-trans isomerase FkpA